MNEKDTLYARWLSGELSVSELEQLKQSGELQELEAIVKATDGLVMPDFDAQKAYANFSNKHPKTAKIRTIKQRRLAWISGIAASFLVIVLAVFLTNNRPQKIQAANASNAEFELLDGSQVVLNDGSSLEYAKRNWENERLVQLKGEAYFEVKQGSSFIVESENGSVEVLGTQFNVNAWGSQLYVECYEGRVQVKSNEKALTLNPQQTAKLINGTLVLDSISHSNPLWQNGISRFYETPAYEVFEEVARQFDVNIKASQIRPPFSGSFKHDDLENALEAICKPLELRFVISEDKNMVSVLRKE